MAGKAENVKTQGGIQDKEKSHKEQRKKKLRAIGHFAGGIANDFNEIFSALTGYIQMARLDTDLGTPARKNLDYAMDIISRGNDLVLDILSYSQESGLKKGGVGLNEAAKKCLASFRSSLPDKIKIKERIECAGDRVQASFSQIKSILTNLCTNASCAMIEKGGIIDVQLEKKHFNKNDPQINGGLAPGDYAVLTVSDTGCGMDEDTMEKIFDPYFSTNGFGPGSGMGLAFVYHIVEMCGGLIDVKSELNKGTTFTVLLPVV
jgi:signal transduction histidine kinase